MGKEFGTFLVGVGVGFLNNQKSLINIMFSLAIILMGILFILMVDYQDHPNTRCM